MASQSNSMSGLSETLKLLALEQKEQSNESLANLSEGHKSTTDNSLSDKASAKSSKTKKNEVFENVIL